MCADQANMSAQLSPFSLGSSGTREGVSVQRASPGFQDLGVRQAFHLPGCISKGERLRATENRARAWLALIQ